MLLDSIQPGFYDAIKSCISKINSLNMFFTVLAYPDHIYADELIDIPVPHERDMRIIFKAFGKNPDSCEPEEPTKTMAKTTNDTAMDTSS